MNDSRENHAFPYTQLKDGLKDILNYTLNSVVLCFKNNTGCNCLIKNYAIVLFSGIIPCLTSDTNSPNPPLDKTLQKSLKGLSMLISKFYMIILLLSKLMKSI